MLKKGTKLYSILKGKCPRCHEGAFFKYPFTFIPNKIIQTHKNCSNCGLKYMLEPSFYYGAMYVNYGITVGLSIAIFLVCKLLFNMTLLQSLIAIIIALFVFAPINLRLARILWINMFVSFDENFDHSQKVN